MPAPLAAGYWRERPGLPRRHPGASASPARVRCRQWLQATSTARRGRRWARCSRASTGGPRPRRPQRRQRAGDAQGEPLADRFRPLRTRAVAAGGWRERNLRRLERSLAKLRGRARAAGAPVSRALQRAYAPRWRRCRHELGAALPRRGQCAAAVELGSATAVIERDGAARADDRLRPGGADRVPARATARMPTRCSSPTCTWTTSRGLERLFFATYFDPARRGKVRLYVPVTVLPHLQSRVADYPGVRGRGRRQLVGRVPAGAGDARLLAPRRAPTKCSRCATTCPTPRSACACAAAWCGPAIRARSRKCWPATPTPATDRARLRAARQPVAQRHRRPRARVSRRAARALRALPLRHARRRARRCARAATASPAPARRCRWPTRVGPGAVSDLQHSMPAPPRDVLGRPLRDLRLSVIETCNFRCPYCMPADRIADDHGAGRAPAACRSTRSKPLVRALRAAGRAQAAPDRRRAAAAQAPAGAGGAAGARSPGIDDLALTTNGSLLARPGTRPARGRPAADHGEPGHAGCRRCSARCPAVAANCDDVLGRHRRRQRRRLRARSSSTAWSSAASTTTGIERLAGYAPRHGARAALHRVHGRGHLQRLVARAAWCRRRELRDRIAARWPLRALDAELSRRSGRALRLRGRRAARWASSVRSATPFCGDCHRARLSADGQLLHLPVRRPAATICAHVLAGARTRWPNTSPACGARARDRYSELRASRRLAASRSRCTSSAAERR